MSAREVLQAAVLAQLRGVTGLGVFDAPPARGAVPHGVVEEPVLQALDGAGLEGRIGTVAVTLRDEGERPVRLRRLIATSEEAVAALPRSLPEGWRVAGLRLARSRLTQGRGGQWTGSSEFAVRMFRLNG